MQTTDIPTPTDMAVQPREELPAKICSSPIGSRSGLPFETLRMMARSKRMERGQHSRDPFYYHSADCQGCEQECNGIRGDHIAQDAKDIAGWTNDEMRDGERKTSANTTNAL